MQQALIAYCKMQKGSFSSKEGTKWNASIVTVSPTHHPLPTCLLRSHTRRDDLTAKTREGKAWLFENILGHMVSPEGPLQFHIQWNGPYKPTWEPRPHVSEEAIAKYFLALRKKENSENNETKSSALTPEDR